MRGKRKSPSEFMHAKQMVKLLFILNLLVAGTNFLEKRFPPDDAKPAKTASPSIVRHKSNVPEQWLGAINSKTHYLHNLHWQNLQFYSTHTTTISALAPTISSHEVRSEKQKGDTKTISSNIRSSKKIRQVDGLSDEQLTGAPPLMLNNKFMIQSGRINVKALAAKLSEAKLAYKEAMQKYERTSTPERRELFLSESEAEVMLGPRASPPSFFKSVAKSTVQSNIVRDSQDTVGVMKWSGWNQSVPSYAGAPVSSWNFALNNSQGWLESSVEAEKTSKAPLSSQLTPLAWPAAGSRPHLAADPPTDAERKSEKEKSDREKQRKDEAEERKRKKDEEKEQKQNKKDKDKRDKEEKKEKDKKEKDKKDENDKKEKDDKDEKDKKEKDEKEKKEMEEEEEKKKKEAEEEEKRRREAEEEEKKRQDEEWNKKRAEAEAQAEEDDRELQAKEQAVREGNQQEQQEEQPDGAAKEEQRESPDTPGEENQETNPASITPEEGKEATTAEIQPATIVIDQPPPGTQLTQASSSPAWHAQRTNEIQKKSAPTASPTEGPPPAEEDEADAEKEEAQGKKEKVEKEKGKKKRGIKETMRPDPKPEGKSKKTEEKPETEQEGPKKKGAKVRPPMPAASAASMDEASAVATSKRKK